MDENALRALICDTGRELLKTGLVARTWGNVSCRVDNGRFLITPSGLDYMKTQPEDIVAVDLKTMKHVGARKPSSEKGIHAAAYELFPEVGFVIHTHQNAASALGLAGFADMEISASERESLGGIALAEYGLPGTKKLKNAVKSAMQTGAHTVLMAHHGAVICGRDKDEALSRALLLEDICRRAIKTGNASAKRISPDKVSALLSDVRAEIPDAALGGGEFAVMWANEGKTLRSQLDDMAQMIGANVKCVRPKAKRIIKALKRSDAVYVRRVGAFVRAAEDDDRDALILLTEKGAMAAVHTRALGVKAALSLPDAKLMRFVYEKKYSKKKG